MNSVLEALRLFAVYFGQTLAYAFLAIGFPYTTGVKIVKGLAPNIAGAGAFIPKTPKSLPFVR
jgi:hypothetical protein